MFDFKNLFPDTDTDSLLVDLPLCVNISYHFVHCLVFKHIHVFLPIFILLIKWIMQISDVSSRY